ncbi:MAG: hypothetical protein OFPI_13520 [Osedax symbiont Rs2]|nr:MAG: hypothetical protein OFPI_13520 [Osedax symbiont Rs2]
MSKQGNLDIAASVSPQKAALYQSKALHWFATLVLLSYLFSLFMLAPLHPGATDSGNKGNRVVDSSTDSAPLTGRQWYSWQNKPRLMAQHSAQTGAFELWLDISSKLFIDLINSDTLLATTRCMTRGFAKILIGFRQLFYNSSSFMR